MPGRPPLVFWHCEPNLTLREYVARGPKGGEATRIRYAAALAEAGIPD